MFDIQYVKNRVLNIMAEEIKNEDLQLKDSIFLSSIQILKALAKVEKEFLVEVDDRYVFHGLFSSPKVLSSYICYELGLSDDEKWLEDIKK